MKATTGRWSYHECGIIITTRTHTALHTRIYTCYCYAHETRGVFSSFRMPDPFMREKFSLANRDLARALAHGAVRMECCYSRSKYMYTYMALDAWKRSRHLRRIVIIIMSDVCQGGYCKSLRYALVFVTCWAVSKCRDNAVSHCINSCNGFSLAMGRTLLHPVHTLTPR